MRETACLTLALVAAALAGCGPSNRALARLQLRQAPDRAGAAGQAVDGTYKGLLTATNRPGGMACPPTQEGTLVIGDRTLFLAYTPDYLFTAPIAKDGTVSAHAGDATLAGTLTDGRLRFDVTTPECHTAYAFRYAA